MKNFGIVVLSLVAGILSSPTIAANSSNSQPVLEEIVTNTPGIINAAVLILKSKGIATNFRHDCDKYGGEQAYKDFVESVGKFVVDGTSIASKVIADSDEDMTRIESFIFFITKVCPVIPTMENSTRNLLESYKNCLEPDARGKIASDGGVLIPLIAYACAGRGQHLLQLEYNIDTPCRRMVNTESGTCINDISVDNSYDGVDNAIDWTISLLTSDLSLENCEYIESVRNCVLESYKKCEDRKIVELLNGVFEIIDNHSSCQTLLKEKSSENEASSADTLRVFSFTSLMAIFKFL